MVKLPINLTDEVHREAALRDAVRKRNELEGMARREREETSGYIRHIQNCPYKLSRRRSTQTGYTWLLFQGVSDEGVETS
jgi:hypothetical protein